jgi:ATP-dependent Lhr-like helicase
MCARPRSRKGVVPSWQGSKMALSAELADAVLELLQAAAQGDFDEPRAAGRAPMLQTQARLSHIPTPGMLLVEAFQSREGQHLYVYPFAGRNVHLGLASLLAWRLAHDQPNTFSLSVNDYGFELLSAEPFEVEPVTTAAVFTTHDLMHDVLASLNASELAQRRFREIARVAGLVNTGYPGQPKSTRQLQASSSLFFEVFRKYDAGNLLLTQAEREVLSQELDLSRRHAALPARAAHRGLRTAAPPQPVQPAADGGAFPREAQHRAAQRDRLDRILRDMEQATGRDQT